MQVKVNYQQVLFVRGKAKDMEQQECMMPTTTRSHTSTKVHTKCDHHHQQQARANNNPSVTLQVQVFFVCDDVECATFFFLLLPATALDFL